MGKLFCQGRVVNPQDLGSGPGRIGQGAEQIKNGSDPYFPAPPPAACFMAP
jgi:hypothetical protein